MIDNLRIFKKLLCGFAILLVLAAPSPAEAPKKVAILPFTMNAQQDLTFLQEGIMDMLSTRLAWKDRLQVVEKPLVKSKVAQTGTPLNKEKALNIGQDLGTDYVILGSITVFGESVSLDAKILDVAKGEELISAFKQTKGMEEVIPAVNAFAEDINAKIMGRYVPPSYAARPEEPEAGAGALLRAGIPSGSRKVTHTQRFDMEIISLDVADLDGDGQNELVIAEEHKLHVYKWQENRFVKMTEAKEGWAPSYVWVDAADLDGDKKAEIYVSNLSEATVSSLVLQWQGKSLSKVSEGAPWFLRVTDIPGQGERLIGQRRMTNGSFKGDVHLMEIDNSEVSSKDPLPLPRHSNVFNFAYLRLKDGDTVTVLQDRYEKIRVFNRTGEQIWRSNEHYGGSLVSLPTGSSGGMSRSYRNYPLPSPIFLADVDEDGQEELVICQNHSRTARLTENFREFDSGKVLFMEWDGVGLTTEWTSQKVQGAVAGYVIDDVDHDGMPELLVASVTSQRHFVGVAKKSQIVVYDLK
jgi:TolB-like protein